MDLLTICLYSEVQIFLSQSLKTHKFCSHPQIQPGMLLLRLSMPRPNPLPLTSFLPEFSSNLTFSALEKGAFLGR